MKLTKRNTVITAALVSASMLLSKFFGMFRDIIVASLYGTDTVEAIAFSTASRIPLLFFDIALGSAVTSAFIPIYNDLLKNKGKEKATDFSNKFITLVTIITGVMVVFGIFFSSSIASIIATGLNPQQLYLASFLVKILFPIILITGVAYCFVGILQSDGEFLIPAIISLVSNFFLILYLIFVGNKLGVTGVATAMLLCWSLQIFVQVPSLRNIGYKLQLKNPFKDSNIKKVCVLALPIIVSTWVQPINTVININLASHLNNGAAITSLDFANKLYIILVGVFAYTVTNITFPALSKMASSNDIEGYTITVNKSIRYILLIIMPVMAGFLILSTPIIRLFYERGAFDSNSTYLTSSALRFYSLGMVGYAISEISNKAFYSIKDGKTPMRISMIGISINIVLSLFFVKIVKTGLEGLAFSASFAANFTAVTMLILLNKKANKHLFDKKLFLSVIKIVISTLIMSVGVIITYRYILSFSLGKILDLIVPVSIGALLYLICCIMFKTEEFFEILSVLFKKVRGGQMD